jgi:hypothetical protein
MQLFFHGTANTFMVDQTVLAGIGFKYGGSLVKQNGMGKNSMESNGLTVVACVGPTDKRS